MDSTEFEQAAQVYHARTIQTEPLYRGAANWCLPDHSECVLAPGEVLCPSIKSRIVEAHFLTCQGINPSRCQPLEAITAQAGVCQVIFLIRATIAQWMNVFHRKGTQRVALRAAAILAEIPSPLRNTLTDTSTTA